MKNNLKELKVIFMGTPDFGAPVFLALIDKGNIVAAITQPDKKVGRKQEITQPPIKKIALENRIEVLQPTSIKNNAKFIQSVKSLQPDLIVVVAYGFILPKEILEIPKFGVINIHASLLPKYRGASPIQAAILNGDKETGVTIMLIDDKMDHGPLLSQKQITITNNDNFESLHDKLAQLGADLFLETLPKYISGEIKPVAQNESEVTYCKILTKKDGKIEWSNSAEQIEKQIRAYTPWPGAFTFWEGKQLKVLKSKVVKSENQKVGEVSKVNEGIAINCGKDALEILELQLEGKKPMGTKEFLNGYPEIISSKL